MNARAMFFDTVIECDLSQFVEGNIIELTENSGIEKYWFFRRVKFDPISKDLFVKLKGKRLYYSDFKYEGKPMNIADNEKRIKELEQKIKADILSWLEAESGEAADYATKGDFASAYGYLEGVLFVLRKRLI